MEGGNRARMFGILYLLCLLFSAKTVKSVSDGGDRALFIPNYGMYDLILYTNHPMSQWSMIVDPTRHRPPIHRLIHARRSMTVNSSPTNHRSIDCSLVGHITRCMIMQ